LDLRLALASCLWFSVILTYMALLKVYFAHPCFTKEQENFKKGFLARFQALCQTGSEDSTIEIVDPFQFAPIIEGTAETKLKMSNTVKDICLRLLEECDLLLGLTDWDDTGVAFEAGYAHCLGKPVLLISSARSDEANAMLIGASKTRFDSILSEGQMEKLVSYLQWRFRSVPDPVSRDRNKPVTAGSPSITTPARTGGEETPRRSKEEKPS
jgi:nucleoside 2-deoxyribosyltransferase